MHLYHGKVLIIDLTTRASRVEELSPSILKGYLGGVGLATRLLYQYAPVGVDAFSPDNPLVFASSGLGGTVIPAASKHAVATKSPLTGLIGDSLSSSHWSLSLKRTGFDAIVVTGTAEKPTYLFIDNAIVHFKKAEHLWGKGSPDTELAIRSEIGDDRVTVATIGPGGENLVRYACITNDINRQAGRTGTGAVMGSKKLKAIALRGTRAISVHNLDEVERVSFELIKKAQGKGTEKYRVLGTPVNVQVLNRLSALPTRNFQQSSFDKAENVSGERLAEHNLTRVMACATCPVACSHIYKVADGAYHGTQWQLDYESLYALGPLCGIDHIPGILKAAELCDHYGVDTISTGASVAWAMECFEKGLLTKQDTDGTELTFGNHAALVSVIEQIGTRRGVGNLLAEGVRLASSRLGGGSEHWAMHSKGLELPGYDPRAMKTLAVGFAVGLRGACHNRSPAYEVDMSGQVNRFKDEAGRGVLVKDQEDFAAVLDSLVICKFTRRCFSNFYDEMAYLYSQATGLDMTPQELKKAGERINNIKKAFNIREGWQRSDDWLPPRVFSDPVTEGEGKGTVISEEGLSLMISDYYQARGWTVEGLIPDEKMCELEIEDSVAPVKGLQYGKKIYNL
ncbi:MAG: aldehyde ferredoxin oxidoreductase family protein [Chloroflexi bacterium]|nr:aldehyde ferredoxin oxidoreductase family protein [Chloroflexota bacterium]